MGINRKYKDRIFCMLFGYPKYKKNLLELFNALNGTNYEDENELEINTIADPIYMGMKNDVSCIIQSNMAMYEQQSTWNPNMPLRGILYSARLFSKYIKANKLNIYSEKLIKIPTPQYYVFYNGKKKIGDKVILKLSDAFSAPQNEGQFEWTATVLNVNEGHNEELLSKCKILREYAILVDRIKENKQKYDTVEETVESAVDYCIKNNILREFLREHRSEVIMSLLTEYDEEETMGYVRRDAYRDGEKAGMEKGIEQGMQQGEMTKLISMVNKKRQKGKSIEEIVEDLEEDRETIEKIVKVIEENGQDFNVDVVYKTINKME